MDGALTVEQKASRFASPLVGERSSKRSRWGPEHTEEAAEIVDIVADGDALLVVDGLSAMPDKRVQLRVSTFALTLASPVLKTQLANASTKNGAGPQTTLALPEVDGDTALAVCNIIHLRNDKLPPAVTVEQLHRIVLFAHKYDCVVAIGRSTFQWFSQLHNKGPGDLASLCKIIESAYFLDIAEWFARFTSLWVLRSSLLAPSLPSMHSVETAKLVLTLASQQRTSHIRLRMDLDTMVDIAARCFSREYKHYIDYAPEMSPDPSETPSGKPATRCHVDAAGAQDYLGALREAAIWPSDVWFTFRDGEGDERRSARITAEEANAVSIGDVVERMAAFSLPEYDDADRCEFCDGVRVEFAAAVKATKAAQRERLWGLCLDCLNAGGLNHGACRFEHAKPVQAKQKALPAAQPGVPAQNAVHQDVPSGVSQANAPQRQEVGGLGIEGL